MIYFLVLSLILFLPGNLILFAMALLFSCPSKFIKKELPCNLFILLAVWMLIGCFFSKSFLVSFYGCVYRVEGWLMWVIMARLAWCYWSEFDNLDAFMAMVISLCIIYVSGMAFLGAGYFNNLNVAGFAAVAFAILWSVNKKISVLAILPVILLTANRSAILASLASIIIPVLFLKNKKIFLYSSALFFLFVSLCFLIPSVRDRFFHINFSSMGNGFRMQLSVQASHLYAHLPITGFGLDSLIFHLTKPVGTNFQDNCVAERTHNICYDLVLMTGWIGYLICLAILSSCIWITMKNPSTVNIACLSGLTAWIVFGMMNPQGCAAHSLMLICIFGFKRISENE